MPENRRSTSSEGLWCSLKCRFFHGSDSLLDPSRSQPKIPWQCARAMVQHSKPWENAPPSVRAQKRQESPRTQNDVPPPPWRVRRHAGGQRRRRRRVWQRCLRMPSTAASWSSSEQWTLRKLGLMFWGRGADRVSKSLFADLVD